MQIKKEKSFPRIHSQLLKFCVAQTIRARDELYGMHSIRGMRFCEKLLQSMSDTFIIERRTLIGAAGQHVSKVTGGQWTFADTSRARALIRDEQRTRIHTANLLASFLAFSMDFSMATFAACPVLIALA